LKNRKELKQSLCERLFLFLKLLAVVVGVKLLLTFFTGLHLDQREHGFFFLFFIIFEIIFLLEICSQPCLILKCSTGVLLAKERMRSFPHGCVDFVSVNKIGSL
jgi:hypothetical protein